METSCSERGVCHEIDQASPVRCRVGSAVCHWKCRKRPGNGAIEDLGTLGGNSSGALSVSKSGLVTGWSETDIVDSSGETVVRAFLWKNGVMHDLGSLGGPVSFGQDVNEHGQVVGFSFLDSTTVHPFFWENGHMTDLSLG